MSLTLRTIARALGGEVQGRQVLCPGPNHSRNDRSMSVRLSHQSPTGWIVHSYVGDRFDVCRDHVAAKLGLGPDAWKRRDAAWTEVTKRKVGNPNRDQETGRLIPSLDNIQDRPEAPTGNSAEAGLRKLQKAAAEGNEEVSRIARAVAIWNEAGDARGSIVETYLKSRGLDLETVDNIHGCLRFHPRCPWRDEAENRTVYVPAMVALMRSVTTDEPQAIHRTRLTPEGAKLGRRMLGIAAGAAVKLDADDAVTMGLAIGEGIETALAARQLGFRPAWALGSAGGISAFPVLGGVECLTVLAETDDTNARAVESCASRWHAAGREVIVIEPAVGSDLNDAMRGAA